MGSNENISCIRCNEYSAPKRVKYCRLCLLEIEVDKIIHPPPNTNGIPSHIFVTPRRTGKTTMVNMINNLKFSERHAHIVIPQLQAKINQLEVEIMKLNDESDCLKVATNAAMLKMNGGMRQFHDAEFKIEQLKFEISKNTESCNNCDYRVELAEAVAIYEAAAYYLHTVPVPYNSESNQQGYNRQLRDYISKLKKIVDKNEPKSNT